VEKTKKTDEGSQMIINLSCLVYMDKYRELGEELDGINKMWSCPVFVTAEVSTAEKAEGKDA
jgi:hypothetical protein